MVPVWVLGHEQMALCRVASQFAFTPQGGRPATFLHNYITGRKYPRRRIKGYRAKPNSSVEHIVLATFVCECRAN